MLKNRLNLKMVQASDIQLLFTTFTYLLQNTYIIGLYYVLISHRQ